MKIRVDFGYSNGDGANLAEHLGFVDRRIYVEASTVREVFEYLWSQSLEAQEVFQLRFNPIGLLDGRWAVIVNRDTTISKGIRSEADLDAPLKEGDRIYITSAS